MALFENIFQKQQNNSENIITLKKSTLKELPLSRSRPVNQGLHGEEVILHSLQKCKIPMWILHDVYLFDDTTKNYAQIDFIVVSPYSIFIIESKYVESDVLLSDSGCKIYGKFINGNTAWEQVTYHKEILTNILQKSSMKDCFSSIFSNSIQTYVVYSNTDRSVINNCENEIMQKNILHINSLVSRLNELALPHNVAPLDEKMCNQIAHFILQKHNEDKLNEFYVDKIKKHTNNYHESKNGIKQIKCPISNCSGHLYLRPYKDTFFVACSNYPSLNEFQKKEHKGKMPSIAQYAYNLIEANGIPIYSWNQECYFCKKKEGKSVYTTVYTYLLHYDLFRYDENFKKCIPNITIGMGAVYSDKPDNTRYNLPQLDDYLKVLSDSQGLNIDWAEGKKAGGKYLANHCIHCGKFQGRAHVVERPESSDIREKIDTRTLTGEDWNITCNHAGGKSELLTLLKEILNKK